MRDDSAKVNHPKFGEDVLRMLTVWVMLVALSSADTLSAQNPKRVDFRRDVQPLFKQFCLDCHGPRLQMSGFRLDRRQDAMRGGTAPAIGRGDSAASRLYLKLIGNRDYGGQMPPAGPLKEEQIQTIKAWIDQGAEWPDDVSGELTPKPADPMAARLMEALRNGESAPFRKLLKEEPRAANRQGPGGSTPLMYAALYADSSAVRLLLQAGADPNVRNHGGATALMWAVPDLEVTRLLLDHGADANARSEDGRTPLLIAASWRNSSATLKLLLARGANPIVKSAGGAGSPLAEAAYLGELSSVETLIEGGADLKETGDAVGLALWSRCPQCAARLAQTTRPQDLVFSLELLARLGDESGVGFLLDHGADPKIVGVHGRTALMYAAGSDTIPVSIVKTLLERGADVNAVSVTGETAVQFATLRGDTPVVRQLLESGANQTVASNRVGNTPAPASAPQIAIARSIPLLQRSDVTFLRKTGCVSCHNNSLTAMSVASARKAGIPVDETAAKSQLSAIASYLDSWRERLLQNVGLPGDADGCGYLLLGLAAERYSPDEATDAAARFLASRQLANGSWRIVEHRPPLESSDIEVTAVAIRALQAYAPKAQRARYDMAIQRAAAWLAGSQPKTTEELAFRVLGMAWAGSSQDAIRKAAQDLRSKQLADGGWAQIPTLGSDAYATGQALVALAESGNVTADHDVFERGARFLLGTQLSDGSWHVRSRSTPFQPYFDSDFPHEHDQWISAAATNWATRALTFAVR